jgi:hypothetical protein
MQVRSEQYSSYKENTDENQLSVISYVLNKINSPSKSKTLGFDCQPSLRQCASSKHVRLKTLRRLMKRPTSLGSNLGEEFSLHKLSYI